MRGPSRAQLLPRRRDRRPDAAALVPGRRGERAHALGHPSSTLASTTARPLGTTLGSPRRRPGDRGDGSRRRSRSWGARAFVGSRQLGNAALRTARASSRRSGDAARVLVDSSDRLAPRAARRRRADSRSLASRRGFEPRKRRRRERSDEAREDFEHGTPVAVAQRPEQDRIHVRSVAAKHSANRFGAPSVHRCGYPYCRDGHDCRSSRLSQVLRASQQRVDLRCHRLRR